MFQVLTCPDYIRCNSRGGHARWIPGVVFMGSGFYLLLGKSVSEGRKLACQGIGCGNEHLVFWFQVSIEGRQRKRG
jgi:hypothetical protein